MFGPDGLWPVRYDHIWLVLPINQSLGRVCRNLWFAMLDTRMCQRKQREMVHRMDVVM